MFEEFSRFACNEPSKLSDETLKTQLELVNYQVENDLILQAVELAREWLVNYCIYKLDYKVNEWLKKDVREIIEKTLNAFQRRRRGEEYIPTGIMDMLESVDEHEKLIKVWDKLSQLRNDLAHCGMREQPRSINSIYKDAREIVEELNKLYSRLA
jgi:hypothetical protein